MLIETFQVKHQWRFKRITSQAAGNGTEMLSYGFVNGSYFSIFNSSRLWASLFLRPGVCNSRPTWKLKEKTDSSLLWMVQVVNYLLLKEKRLILLMLVRRHRLQVLIQQKQKWKRWYKTWMFKYKVRLKQAQVLLLHVVIPLERSSCSVWHRWRSKDDSTYPSEMVCAVEWQKGIEIEAGAFKTYILPTRFSS